MSPKQILDYKYEPEIIEKSIGLDSFTTIKFGNTGLFIAFDPSDDEWQIHFTPEKSDVKMEDKVIEFGLRFVLGIDLLMKWFHSHDFENSKYPKPTLLYGETNEPMSFFAKNMIDSTNKKIYIEVKNTRSNYNVALDLDLLSTALKTISSDSKYMKRLKQAEELFS